EAEDGSGQGRHEIDLRESHAIDGEIAQQRFRDQAEPLRASWECADHGQGGHAEHDPAIVNTRAGALVFDSRAAHTGIRAPECRDAGEASSTAASEAIPTRRPVPDANT